MEESIDIWEAANIADNDSDGNLLAEYLKKKTKKVFTRRIFEENGNKRVSVEVCLRKANSVEKENRADTQKNEKPVTSELGASLEDGSLSENCSNVKNNEMHSASFNIPLARSPLAGYMKRTPHSSDRMRRTTLRRLIHQNSGRRTLLDQFNNVMDIDGTSTEFVPHVASTPVYAPTECQTPINKLMSPSNKNSTKHNAAPSSPRRYTIEKGKSPGQILLTPVTSPDKNHVNELSVTCNTKMQENNQISKLTKRVKSICQDSVEQEFSNSQKIQKFTDNSSDNRSVANSCRARDAESYQKHQSPLNDKLEAQNNILTTNKQIELKDKTMASEKIVTTFGGKCLPKNTDVSLEVSSNDPEPSQNGDETFNVRNTKLTYSVPKLSDNVNDMITDDEEPISEEISREANTSNHKANKFLTRTRKFRKKQTKNSNITSKELDSEFPLSCGLSKSRKCLPMNKAPRTPINGEKYAPELKKQLAGLSNFEILDLRKRKSNAFTKKKSKNKVSDLLPNSTNFENNGNDCAIEKNLINEPDLLQPGTQCFQKELFQDETNCDRVSFFSTDKNTISNNQKVKRGVRTPEIYKSYINATQQIAELGRKLNETKRSLYSNVTLQETSTSVEIVPPPPMFRSSTPRKLASPLILSSSEHNTSNTVNFQESPTNTQSRKDDEEIFKKPNGIPVKQKKAKSKQKSTNSRNDSPVEQKSLLEESSSLRRSKRCRKEVPKSLFWIMWEKNFLRSMEEKQKRKNTTKSLQQNSKVNNNSDSEMIPIACSTANPKPVVSNGVKKKVRNPLKKSAELKEANGLAPIAELSKHTEEVENTKANTKRLRVKVKRLNALNTPQQSKMVSSSSPSDPSLVMSLENCQGTSADQLEPEKYNFLTWLKSLTNEQTVSNSTCQNPLIQMSFSFCNELTFTSFNDVDYAFYNTKEKNFLGYIRFQPRQIKPPSRAKQHNLHFLILSGEFKIISNEESGYSRGGDLVSINQGCRYSIENISDDVGILFFVKK